jgi:protein-S-isoprenylcysteine O-methyltransferase Ste14
MPPTQQEEAMMEWMRDLGALAALVGIWGVLAAWTQMFGALSGIG